MRFDINRTNQSEEFLNDISIDTFKKFEVFAVNHRSCSSFLILPFIISTVLLDTSKLITKAAEPIFKGFIKVFSPSNFKNHSQDLKPHFKVFLNFSSKKLFNALKNTALYSPCLLRKALQFAYDPATTARKNKDHLILRNAEIIIQNYNEKSIDNTIFGYSKTIEKSVNYRNYNFQEYFNVIKKYSNDLNEISSQNFTTFLLLTCKYLTDNLDKNLNNKKMFFIIKSIKTLSEKRKLNKNCINAFLYHISLTKKDKEKFIYLQVLTAIFKKTKEPNTISKDQLDKCITIFFSKKTCDVLYIRYNGTKTRCDQLCFKNICDVLTQKSDNNENISLPLQKIFDGIKEIKDPDLQFFCIFTITKFLDKIECATQNNQFYNQLNDITKNHTMMRTNHENFTREQEDYVLNEFQKTLDDYQRGKSYNWQNKLIRHWLLLHLNVAINKAKKEISVKQSKQDISDQNNRLLKNS